jgi:hypothetical protein
MTHGCLLIVCYDHSGGKVSRHTLLMHTYHSGYLIPEAVLASIKVLARRNSYMLDIRKDNITRDEDDCIDQHLLSLTSKEQIKPFGVDDVYSWLRSGMCGGSSLYWPTSLAALISCAMPGLLETTPPQYVKYLPTWGGQKQPYKMILNESADDGGWKLYDEPGEDSEGLLFACDPAELLAREMALMYYGGLGGKQWPDGYLT